MRKIFLPVILGLLLTAPPALSQEDDYWVGSLTDGSTVLTENAQTLDWISSGSALAQGVGPEGIPLEVGITFTFRYQSSMIAATASDGTDVTPAGLLEDFEYTIVAEVPEQVISLTEYPDSTSVLFTTLSGGQFFIYYDASPDANVSTGTGFDDGILIASGTILANQISDFNLDLLEGEGIGASIIRGEVDYVDPDYLDPSANIIGWRFEGTQNFPPEDSATTAFFLSPDGEGNLADYNVIAGEDLLLKVDGSSRFIIEQEEGIGCRVTGGGTDSAGLAEDGVSWDGTLAEVKVNGNSNWFNTYQFGGQAGANTALQPQPKGEWTHHQQKGPDGSFIFHAGTASAPSGTEIALIECSDPGNCLPARPAPAKQIDFNGVGTFKNIKDAPPSLAEVIPGVTFHYFEVHIEDLGEPGKNGKQSDPDTALCPPEGSAGEVANCGCPDFYRITIYEDTTSESDVIYEVYGYLDGGNLQIHPPTGFDTN